MPPFSVILSFMAIPPYRWGGGPSTDHLNPLMVLKSFLSDFGMLDSADFFALTNGVAGLDLDATRLHRLR